MQPADECLDPALMSAFAGNPFGQWRCPEADAGPPSPFDLSTIDPDLLALYPEQKDNSTPTASGSLVPVDAQNLSLSAPPLQDESLAPDSTTDNTKSRTDHDFLLSRSGQTCTGQSESPPPIWIPPRGTSALAPQIARTTRDARSSALPAQPAPHPRIPSLAAQHKSPGAKSAARSQKRAPSPTPDSEEDDFAASFMRKRRVAAGMLSSLV